MDNNRGQGGYHSFFKDGTLWQNPSWGGSAGGVGGPQKGTAGEYNVGYWRGRGAAALRKVGVGCSRRSAGSFESSKKLIWDTFGKKCLS